MTIKVTEDIDSSGHSATDYKYHGKSEKNLIIELKWDDCCILCCYYWYCFFV